MTTGYSTVFTFDIEYVIRKDQDN